MTAAENNSIPQQWERRKRVLHIVDIENLVGDEHASADRFAFEHAVAAYAMAAKMKADDPVMVGCHPGLVFIAQEMLGSRGQIFTGCGTDGADLALLGAVDPAFVAGRYHLVSIGSGDHIFADLATKLVERGVQVRVVAQRGRLSARLSNAANQVEFLAQRSQGVA